MKNILSLTIALCMMTSATFAQEDSSTFVIHPILNRHRWTPKMFKLVSTEDHYANRPKFIKYSYNSKELMTLTGLTYNDVELREQFVKKNVLLIEVKTTVQSNLSGKYYFRHRNNVFVPIKKEPF